MQTTPWLLALQSVTSGRVTRTCCSAVVGPRELGAGGAAGHPTRPGVSHRALLTLGVSLCVSVCVFTKPNRVFRKVADPEPGNGGLCLPVATWLLALTV